MEGKDLVKIRTGKLASSEFDSCYGRFKSLNQCFKDRKESKNRKIAGKKLSYVEVKSCQGSSITWCSYAVEGQYHKDPHADPAAVWKAQSAYETLPTIGADWDEQVKIHVRNLVLGLNACKLQIKGGNNAYKFNTAKKAIEEISMMQGVVLIVSEAYHVTAAAFTNKDRGIWHYDNDVGCCLCPDITTWKKWAQWCDELMLDDPWPKFMLDSHHILYMGIEKAQ